MTQREGNGERAIAPTAPIAEVTAAYIASGAADLLTFEAFDVTGDSDVMQATRQQREEQLQAVIDGDIKNPTLNNCPLLSEEREKRQDIALRLFDLVSVQLERKTGGIPQTLEDELLNEVMSRRLGEISFVDCADYVAEQDIGTARRLIIARTLKVGGRVVYGLPEEDRALTILGRRLHVARQIVTTRDHPLAAHAGYVLENVEAEPLDDAGFRELNAETIERYRQILEAECGPAISYAFAEIGQKTMYTPAEMRVIFERYLQHRGFSDEGWHAEITKGRTACAAKMNTTAIEIGEDRPDTMRTFKEVLRSLLHEAEGHAGRNARGRRLGNGLAGHGLLDYTLFEEPFVATMADIYVDGKVKAHGEPYVLAIALAAGMDAGIERDFGDGYEILWRLNALKDYHANKPVKDQMVKAKRSSTNIQTRVWRGMPTEIPGCVFSKDRAYDNDGALAYLVNLSTKDLLRLYVAKYNPLRANQDRHIRELAA